MARTFLTPEIKKWLYENYSSQSNEELAIQLTRLIIEENRRQLESLANMLGFVTQANIRKRVESEIKWRKGFRKVNAAYIKNVACKMPHLKKDQSYISKISKKKANTANVIKWIKHAQVVKEPFKWLKSFKIGEVRICQILKPSDIKMIRNAVSNYNMNESAETGIYFSTELIKEVNLLKVRAIHYNKK